MLCDLCRSNLAKYRVSRIVNGKALNLSLCDECYQNLDSVLASMLQNGAFNDAPCPDCGTTYSTVKATGKFGCPTCYSHFKDRAAALLQNIHGGATHKGKQPNQPVLAAEDTQLLKLKEQLQRCIANQQFEQAAVLRDQIKEMEAQSNE